MSESATAPRATGDPKVNEIELLRSIAEGTASSTGDDFLRNLVRHLAEAVGMRHSFVSAFRGGEVLRTLAFWSNGQFAANVEYKLSGTPCATDSKQRPGTFDRRRRPASHDASNETGGSNPCRSPKN
jgi:hypothetical protein